MNDKRTNLVAGRLGQSPGEGHALPPERGRKAAGYGVERLGITAITEYPPGDAPDRRVGDPHPPVPPTGKNPWRLKAEAIRKGMAALAPAPWHLQPPPRRGAITWARRRRTVLLGGGAAAAITVVLVCWFALSGDKGTPRAASGGEGQAVSAQTPPAAPGNPPVLPEPSEDRALAAAMEKPEVPPAPAERDESPSWSPRESPADAAEPDSPAFRIVAATGKALTDALRLLAARPPPQAPTVGEDVRRPAESPSAPQSTASPQPAPARSAGQSPATAPAASTRPSAFEVAPAGLCVSGIIRGFGQPGAIINNRYVNVGDSVGDAKVVQISEAGVEIELDGRRFLIGVSSPSPARESEPAPANEAPPKPSPTTQPKAEEEES